MVTEHDRPEGYLDAIRHTLSSGTRAERRRCAEGFLRTGFSPAAQLTALLELYDL